MKNAITPIADRLGKLLRMLSSDRDGEVIGAARAIMRILHAENLDIHALASAVENQTKLSEADMRDMSKIYKSGFCGRQAFY